MAAAGLRAVAHGPVPFAAAVATLLAVGMAVAGLLNDPQSVTGTPVGTQVASVQLVDDDEGTALFTAQDMAPGKPRSNCIAVRYVAAGNAGPVHLHADYVTGSLPAKLQVTVERGTGGSLNDCEGFDGETVFHGRLSDLAVPEGTGGSTALVTTDWRPQSGETTTFRFTVAIAPDADDSVQAGTANATFVWSVAVTDPDPEPTTAPPPPTSPPTSTAPATPPVPAPTTNPSATAGVASPTPDVPTQTPEPTDGTSPEPVPTSSLTPEPPTPSEDGTGAFPSWTDPAGPGTSGTPGEGSGGSGDDDGRGWPFRDLEHLVQAAATVATGVVRHSGFSIVPLALVLVFLTVQNRLDAKDPKLAQAPVHPRPHLFFPASRPRGPAGAVRARGSQPPARRQGPT